MTYVRNNSETFNNNWQKSFNVWPMPLFHKCSLDLFWSTTSFLDDKLFDMRLNKRNSG
jgi:hypothetical protein